MFTGTITTVAGPGLPVNGAQATTQPIDFPTAAVPDDSGGFYIVSNTQNKIYRVSADGTLTIVAGTGDYDFSGDGGPATFARLASPNGVTLDAAGNLYIADTDNNRIRKITPGGIISTFAGGGPPNSSGDGGPASSASVIRPYGVFADVSGNVFIAESGRIRRVSPDGTILTTSGGVFSPYGVVADGSGNVYFAVSTGHTIRKISPQGILTIVAGNGTPGFSGDGGPATAAQLNFPQSVAIDGAGNLLIADTENCRIRKVTPDGVISTVVGTGEFAFGGDGGPAVSARINQPHGVAADSSGNIFVPDYFNHRIRKVTPAGSISTVAGNGTYGFSGDGGPAAGARIFQEDIAVDAAGNLLIADRGNFRVRQVTPAGIISTIAGTGIPGFSGDGGPAVAARVSTAYGIAVDAAGNIFVADYGGARVRKINPAGIISTVAGTGVPGFSGDGGPATSARLNNPAGVAVDSTGNLFIADALNNRVRKVTPDGTVSTVAGNGIAGFSGDGGPAVLAQLNFRGGIAVDAAGALYFTDTLNNRVRKVTPDGIISTLAGNGTAGFSGDGGPALSAQLYQPLGLAVDTLGNLFIADFVNARIRMVTPDGIITSVAGTGPIGYSGDGGPAVAAQLNRPGSLALDATGSLFISDVFNYRVRKLTFKEQSDFVISDRGGLSVRSSGTLSATAVGYAAIEPGGRSAPAGLAIFGFRKNNVLVSEAGVPASPRIRTGRSYAEISTTANTGLAIANPNNEPAIVSFYFTNADGNLATDSTTIQPNAQIAKFLNEPPFNGPLPWSGTFTFTSSVPVAVTALYGFTNERGEFLITTLPIVDLDATPSTTPVIFPHFAAGAGWTTDLVIVNPSAARISGNVLFRGGTGSPVYDPLPYSVPPAGAVKITLGPVSQGAMTGSVRLVPNPNSVSPAGVAIFSFRKDSITVAQAGVPAAAAGTAFRLYAEGSASIQAGLAVSNESNVTASVSFELTRLDGSSTGLTGTVPLAAGSQAALYLSQIPGFALLPTTFQGILRVSSVAPISVVALRQHTNERGDPIITTVPPINESVPPPAGPLFFPHIVDSGGYTTQFVLFSGQPGSSPSGTLELFSYSGGALNLTFR